MQNTPVKPIVTQPAPIKTIPGETPGHAAARLALAQSKLGHASVREAVGVYGA